MLHTNFSYSPHNAPPHTVYIVFGVVHCRQQGCALHPCSHNTLSMVASLFTTMSSYSNHVVAYLLSTATCNDPFTHMHAHMYILMKVIPLPVTTRNAANAAHQFLIFSSQRTSHTVYIVCGVVHCRQQGCAMQS